MNIQLKQSEIITALKQYISGKGISLDGKDVKITFTAGRKESGITADLVIEDGDIPGYTNEPAEEEVKVPTLALVQPAKEPDPEPAIHEEPTEDPQPPKTNSLFS